MRNYKLAVKRYQNMFNALGHKAMSRGAPTTRGAYFTVLLDDGTVYLRWWNGTVWSIPGGEREWADKTLWVNIPNSMFSNELLWVATAK